MGKEKRKCPASSKKKTNTVKYTSLSSFQKDQKSDEDFLLKSCDTTFGKTAGRISVVKTLDIFQKGMCKISNLRQIADQTYGYDLKWFNPFRKYEDAVSPRNSAMQWHPTHPDILVVGGKHGNMTMYTNHSHISPTLVESPATGPGGTIEAIRFNVRAEGTEVFFASVDGTVSTYNFKTETRKRLLETEDQYTNWFCSVDVHKDGKTVCGGDNLGKVGIYRLDNGLSQMMKLHSAKVRHLEFNSKDPNLMATASLDKTVKLWDFRMLTDKNSYLEKFVHKTAASSATFSLTDGCRLLTTDMDSELRVYKAPTWSLEHSIQHPHRFFQHMTCIKPSWHPRTDLFMIGKYPDPKLPKYDSQHRTVDVYSANTGKAVLELINIKNNLITSLAMFNSLGTVLASSAGKTTTLWSSYRNAPLLEENK